MIFQAYRRWLVIAVPYVWFIVLLLLPFLYAFRISFSVPVDAIPPYSTIFYYVHQTLTITLKLENYIYLISHDVFFLTLLSSFKIAIITTLLCILIGFPMAYAMARVNPAWRAIFLMLIVIPYWSSLLLRVYAWVSILQRNGLINHLMYSLGLGKFTLIYNNFSIYVGMVYCYLPFFILPVYASLLKIDPIYEQAASDLGARPYKAFFTIILPLSKTGLIAGAMLVFIPAVGEAVIPQILGGVNTLMIGNIIWEEFFTANDWGVASALSVILLILLVLPLVVYQRIDSRKRR